MYPTILIINYFLLSLTFIIGKKIVALANPLIVISLRMIIGGILLISFSIWRNPMPLRINRTNLFLFFKIAFFHIYLAFIAEFWALQYLPSSHVNIIYSFTPIFSAALSYFVLGEVLSTTKLCAIGLGLIGVSPVFFKNLFLNFVTTDRAQPAAEMALIAAVISSTYAWFDISKLMKKYSIVLINGLSMLIGGVAALLTAIVFLRPSDFIISEPLFFSFLLFSLIFISNFLFYNLFGVLLNNYSLNLLTFTGLISPLFGAIWGNLLLNENIDSSFYFTLICLVLSFFIFFKSDLRAKVNQLIQ